jgi:outer membrane protein TolC
VKYDRRRWDSSSTMIFLFILSVAPAALAQSVDVPRRLTLSEARDLLLAHNPALLRDEQDAAIARANVGQARLHLNPELEIDSESYPIFEPRPGSFWNNQELTLRASVSLGGTRSDWFARFGARVPGDVEDFQPSP